MPDYDVAVELFYSGAWQPAAAYTRDGIKLSRGLADESLEPQPGELSATLANRDGAMNPTNPMSPLYGLVGRNTPLRMSAAGDVRLVTEAADWQPRRTLEPVKDTLRGEPSRGDAWTLVKGSGILRRLGRGRKPLRSTAYRSYMAAVNDSTRVDYWPLEEESGALSISSPVGSTPMATSGAVNLGADTTSSPSAERLATFGAGGFTFATVRQYTSTQHKVQALWTIPAGGIPDQAIMLRIYCTGGSIAFFDLVYGFPGAMTLKAYSAGGVFISQSGPWLFGMDGKHLLISVDSTQNGANIDNRILGAFTDGTTWLSAPNTWAGQTYGRTAYVTIGQTSITGAAVGHVIVGSSVTAFDNFIAESGGASGLKGYATEIAGLRMQRLCDEEGVPMFINPAFEDTRPMGPQRAAPLLDLLAECVRTDAGVMYEARSSAELRYTPGRSLYNQASALDLDYAAGQIAEPLEPVIGDQGTRNDVTAKNYRGGSARAVLESGPMSVADPPAGVGRTDGSVDVNAATDGALAHLAGWYLHRGTTDETRYRRVSVDLDATPDLAAAAGAVNIGNRIVLRNLPVVDHPGPAELLVTGVEELIRPKRRNQPGRVITFRTIPASPFETGIVGAADGSVDLRGQAIDTDGSFLASGINAAAVTLSVASPGGVLWTTDANDWSTALHGSGLYGAGLFIVIGGEVMRVTNITGAGSPQTFTVVRSVNGVVKSHLANAAVHVARPVVIAL